jgi:hypothetical protein
MNRRKPRRTAWDHRDGPARANLTYLAASQRRGISARRSFANLACVCRSGPRKWKRRFTPIRRDNANADRTGIGSGPNRWPHQRTIRVHPFLSACICVSTSWCMSEHGNGVEASGASNVTPFATDDRTLFIGFGHRPRGGPRRARPCSGLIFFGYLTLFRAPETKRRSGAADECADHPVGCRPRRGASGAGLDVERPCRASTIRLKFTRISRLLSAKLLKRTWQLLSSASG